MAHEFLLENNSIRIYIGRVDEVSRYEMPSVQDFVGDTLSPMEILFSIEGLIEGARATPIDQTSEVNKGDNVIVFSLENIYSNTYFYHSIRFIDLENKNIYMRYSNSGILLVPISEGSSELMTYSGKSILNIDPILGRINLESDSGGVNINSHTGYVNISNDVTSIKKILDTLLESLIDLKILTAQGPAPITAGSAKNFSKTKLLISDLFMDMKSSHRFPMLPDDTYTVEYATTSVELLGAEFLNDEDEADTENISSLKKKFPSYTIPSSGLQGSPIIGNSSSSNKRYTSVSKVTRVTSEEDILLSENYYLSNLTSKPVFPHKLRAQRGLSKEEIVTNLKGVAVNILEPLREKYPQLVITSGFRSGNSTSQHQVGQAVDVQFPGMNPKDYLDAAEWVVKNISYDQFIFEHGKSIWFHLSFKNSGGNRNSVLTMKSNKYEPGLKLYYK